MGYGAAARHEPIGRTIQLAPPMRVEDVALRPIEGYPDLPPSFHCRPLLADISAATCASNFLTRKSVSCASCPVGMMHARVAPRTAIDVLNDPTADRHARANAAIGLSCVRCERNEHTATKYTGRFRLVDRHCLCINCYNRQAEVSKGANAKGATPRKWAHLQQATITIEDAHGEWRTLDIGMRASRGECERYVARIHAGCTLVEVFIGGRSVQPGEPDPANADWHADAARKGHSARASCKRKRTSPPVASDSEVFSDVNYAPRSRKAVGIGPVEHEAPALADPNHALDPASIAGYWDGMDATGLNDFVAWLAADWPEFATKRAEPSAAFPAAASVEVAEAVTDDSEQPGQESEWAGCYVVRDGVTTYVCDYAKEREITDEDAAIVLGMCDPDCDDEPASAPAAQPKPTPEPGKAAPQPEPKKRTGKQQRKLEKAARRAERQQQRRPSAPKQIAITARAYMQVLFETGTKR